jgi:signal transduction histidine kinase
VAQADPVLLERILRNLVSNAIRYTDDGGVLVSCRPRQGGCCVQVWDSGIGIADSRAAAHLRRVLPGAEQPPAGAAPAQGPGPGPGHRQAPGRR